MINNLSNLKTIFKTLVGTGIATALIGLPVRANEDNLISKTANPEVILSQNFNYRERTNYNESKTDFKTLVGLTGLAVGTGVIGWHLTKAYNPSLINSLPTINKNNASLLDSINPKLRQELLRLVHDRATASRLLSGTLISHPERSPNWLAEKVIYDLKRDR